MTFRAGGYIWTIRFNSRTWIYPLSICNVFHGSIYTFGLQHIKCKCFVENNCACNYLSPSLCLFVCLFVLNWLSHNVIPCTLFLVMWETVNNRVLLTFSMSFMFYRSLLSMTPLEMQVLVIHLVFSSCKNCFVILIIPYLFQYSHFLFGRVQWDPYIALKHPPPYIMLLTELSMLL